MSEIKKTIPIVDVWMFLWRLLFAPLVIALSFFTPIFFCCYMLIIFALIETLSFLVAFVVSVCGRKWVIKGWAQKIYKSFRDDGTDWSLEPFLGLPTKWWKAVTDPPVRKTLSHTANWLSAWIWEMGLLFVIGFSFRARYHGHPSDGAVGNAVLFWIFGLLLLWLALWLVKKILEFLMRWIFQRPRPKPWTQPSTSTSWFVKYV